MHDIHTLYIYSFINVFLGVKGFVLFKTNLITLRYNIALALGKTHVFLVVGPLRYSIKNNVVAKYMTSLY